jgi:ketosteroid isomerase-like protein
MSDFFFCTLLWILHFTNSTYSGPIGRSNLASGSKERVERSLDRQTDEFSTMEPAANGAVRRVRELIERWCAAYGDLDEKKLAALESPDIEIVDRFGELHTAKQRSDEERFWAEGFEMIRREDFRPVCTIEEIRSTGPDVMIVHAEISYPGGIALNGGDYISAFSEMHTFIVSRDEEGWRIAGHDITTRE